MLKNYLILQNYSINHSSNYEWLRKNMLFWPTLIEKNLPPKMNKIFKPIRSDTKEKTVLLPFAESYFFFFFLIPSNFHNFITLLHMVFTMSQILVLAPFMGN